MSDMHHAVEAELEAHWPSQTPPFSILQARKRRRDHRRAVSAVALSALAVLGLGFLSSTLGPGGGDPLRPIQPAGGADSDTAYTLRPSVNLPQQPAAAAAVNRCLDLPGVTGSSAQSGDPPTYNATVNADARTSFEVCAQDIPLYRLELAGRPFNGTLNLVQMEALRDRISSESDALAAQGVVLVTCGPDTARKQVSIGVNSDLVKSDNVLRARYGNDIYVFTTRPLYLDQGN